MAFTQYIGKKDYRGYLNYLGESSDRNSANARNLLGLVGNDAQFGVKNAASGLVNLNKQLYAQYQKLNPGLKPITSMPDFSGIGGAPTIYAPPLNVAAINARARKAAAGAVNPYYSKELSLFLARQGELKKQEQTQYDTNVKNIQDTLTQSLEGSQTNRARTGEDVAKNIADVNQQADYSQIDQGNQFTQDRLSLAAATAGGGGLSAQKQEALQTTNNVTEQRRTQQLQAQKTQQELFKGRTLEDLMKSDALAKTGAEKGKKQAKFDLDNYIKAQNSETTAKKRSLEKQRQADLVSEEKNQRAKRVLSFIEHIANPAQKAAAYSTYGAYI